MRIVAYGGVSTLSATFAVLSAFRQRANFYAAAVYLSKSNACMMILCNFGIFCTIVLAKVLQSIFFGQLRLAEIERLNDRLWFTISETLLALAMFRDEFDTSFVVLFISLIFVKCFHWLAADRVDWMDQAATPPGKLFHARMISILSIIWITDMLLIAYATESVLLHGPSVVLMFEMEYIIMQVTCLSIIAKYVLNSYAHHRAQEHWEGKSTYQFYIDLGTDFLKLITYIGFLSLTLTFHALPINVLRDVYYTFRSFVTKCNNLVRFRQATRNMNERYPNATREEMQVLADKTCIICREEMEFREDPNTQRADPVQNNNNNNNSTNNNAGATVGPNDTPKKLGCGHIFHFHCLRSWLERQQTCPTCRRPVIQSQAAPPAPAANPNAAANRAFAAAMAAAGVGPPPVPPAPPANGRGGVPTAQPAQPPQPGEGDFAPRPDRTRPDFQQRLRELQQRMNAAPFGSNGATPNPALESGSQNPPSTLRLTGANPLASFDLSALSGTNSSKSSSTPHQNEAINLQQAGSSSHSTHLGLSATPPVPTQTNTKDTLPPQSRGSSQSQPETSSNLASKSAQPTNSSGISEAQTSNLSTANTSTTLQNAVNDETKNPLRNFNPLGATLNRNEESLTVEGSSKSHGLTKVESSSVEAQVDDSADRKLLTTMLKIKQEDLIRVPCLIPLYDHVDGGILPSNNESFSTSYIPTQQQQQMILNEYSQKIKQIEGLKSIGNNSKNNKVEELMEIQNSLMDCCSKLVNFVHSSGHDNHGENKTKEGNELDSSLTLNHDTRTFKGKNRSNES